MYERPNWSEKGFVVKKLKDTRPWIYVTEDSNGEEFRGTFYEEEIQNKYQSGPEL